LPADGHRLDVARLERTLRQRPQLLSLLAEALRHRASLPVSMMFGRRIQVRHPRRGDLAQ